MLNLIFKSPYKEDYKKIQMYLFKKIGVIWNLYKIAYYWEHYSAKLCASFLVVSEETLTDFFERYIEEEN